MADIEHLQSIKTPAAQVFEAITTQEGLGQIWTQDLTVRPETGFINEFGFDKEITKMNIIELKPSRRVEWLCIDSDPEWIGTSVTFDLSEKNGVTLVLLRHKNWREVTDFFRSCNYNWGMFLYSLKTYCEEGKGMPYQKRKF